MKIRTTALAAGPEGVVHADTEMEVDDELGKLMIEGGAAVEVESQDVDEEASEDEAEPETASLGQEEVAATRTGRKRGRKRGRRA